MQKDTAPAASKKFSNRYLLKRCAKYFWPYRWHIAIAFIASGGVSLATAGTAYLVKPAMDKIFFEKNEAALLLVPFAYVILTVIKGACRYAQNCLMQSSGLRVLERLRKELYDKIIYLPLSHYEQSQVGLLMSHITNDVATIRNSLPTMLMAVRQFMTIFGLIGVVFYQNTRLAIWAVIVLPLAVYPLVWFGRKLRKYGRRNQSKLADITIVLQEVLSGIRVVKASATEKQEIAHFDEENQRLVKINLKQTYISEFSSPVMELIGALGLGLVMWFGGREVISGNIEASSFFSFGAALIMLYDPIKSLNNSNQEIQRALAGAERVFGLLDNADIMVEQGGTVEFLPPFEKLDFDGVTFTYPDGTVALSDINLSVRAGERVALVGPSGAGKSTFVNLLPRFYDPAQGVISINGVPLPEYTLPSLRRHIATVSQDTFLFNISVRENIAYGTDNPDPAQIEEAARAAFAHEFILELPDGYDTIIGERGVKLSGGQKQRLSIARAILKDAPLLILDEATSALDSQAERIVQKALDNLMEHRTSIVIAHRLSTVLSADRILVLEHGRILDQGTHQELLMTCGLYSRLCAMQFSQETSDAGA